MDMPEAGRFVAGCLAGYVTRGEGERRILCSFWRPATHTHIQVVLVKAALKATEDEGEHEEDYASTEYHDELVRASRAKR